MADRAASSSRCFTSANTQCPMVRSLYLQYKENPARCYNNSNRHDTDGAKHNTASYSPSTRTAHAPSGPRMGRAQLETVQGLLQPFVEVAEERKAQPQHGQRHRGKGLQRQRLPRTANAHLIHGQGEAVAGGGQGAVTKGLDRAHTRTAQRRKHMSRREVRFGLGVRASDWVHSLQWAQQPPLTCPGSQMRRASSHRSPSMAGVHVVMRGRTQWDTVLICNRTGRGVTHKGSYQQCNASRKKHETGQDPCPTRCR